MLGMWNTLLKGATGFSSAINLHVEEAVMAKLITTCGLIALFFSGATLAENVLLSCAPHSYRHSDGDGLVSCNDGSVYCNERKLIVDSNEAIHTSSSSLAGCVTETRVVVPHLQFTVEMTCPSSVTTVSGSCVEERRF